MSAPQTCQKPNAKSRLIDNLNWARAPMLGLGVLLASTSLLSLASSMPVSAQETPEEQDSNDTTTATVESGPRPYEASVISASDESLLASAINAARSKRFTEAESYQSQINDPVARKIVTWMMINNDTNSLGFISLDAARRDLWGWPRDVKRQLAAEKMMATAGLTPSQIVSWFNGAPPQSLDGANQLIAAYNSLGRTADASALAKTWWRSHVFDLNAQNAFLEANSGYLTSEDHQARLDCLLINYQNGSTTAINALLPYVDGAAQSIARAVLSMRSLSASADTLYEEAHDNQPHNKVLAYERARYLFRKGLEPLGYSLLSDLPPATMSPEAASQIYKMRLGYFRSALKAKDYTAAYYAMAGGGFENGENKAESEFFAGWIALSKLNNPNKAIEHFTLLAEAGTSPITQGRASYWLGRAYEARNDTAKNDAQTALGHYKNGGKFIFAFYGQLAAEKAGQKTIDVGKDPVPSEADRTRFNNREMVKAAKILGEMGQVDLFRQFTATLALTLPNTEEEALLVDLTAKYDRQVESMRIARKSMQRGFYLPERAYPLWSIPAVKGPEPALILSITRQETGFDAGLKSHANARGMMQLIPSTARAVSRRMGLPYSEGNLYQPEYNMSLGSYHLGELVDQFGGSYIMAAAGYNAGPSRMGQWVEMCGEPRGESGDALSFIECMPLSETRDYMMRITENIRVYRARLNGGSAPLTAWEDISRGTPRTFGSFNASDSGADLNSNGPVPYTSYQNGETDDTSDAASPAEVNAVPAVDTKPAKATVKSKAKAKPEAKSKSKKAKASKSKPKTSKSKASKSTKKKTAKKK